MTQTKTSKLQATDRGGVTIIETKANPVKRNPRKKKTVRRMCLIGKF
jgi:hypothetical protein